MKNSKKWYAKQEDKRFMRGCENCRYYYDMEPGGVIVQRRCHNPYLTPRIENSYNCEFFEDKGEKSWAD